MIPMADNINHSCVAVTNELINYQKQIDGPIDKNYFKINKFMNDYSALY